LILAGDLWVGTKFIEWAGFSWIGIVSKRFKEVLIVLGNHDYWPMGDLTITKGAEKCNCMLQDYGLLNVQVLDCDTIERAGILFIGATLWTDMNRSDPFAMMNMENVMAYDGKCKYATEPNGAYEKFSSFKWTNTHQKHKDYIKHVCSQNKDKQIVVITHHLPLTFVGDPIYDGDSSNCYYSSDLSDIILDNPQIKFWFHGHSHYQHETKFGETMIVNNCVGYQGEHCEQQGLVKHGVINL
jgi:3',5'-cyclic AMP phosphodiesterase CpdA